MLDLFEGRLSLNDILNQEIPLLNKLKEVKIQRNQQQAQKQGR